MRGDPEAQASPKVSVVLPTYNQADYLPQALDSIFNQTWVDLELIVVNDGSTDDTAQVLADYQQRYRFTVIHQQNQMLPRSLNNGFSRARGEYLTWTSSDNILLPNMLEVLVAALERHPEIGLVYSDWEVIDERGEVLGTARTYEYDPYILMRTNYINASFLYRRACQDAVGFYDPDFLHAEDWEYWLRISRQFKMLHVPEVLYQYRVHKSSLTQTDVYTQEKRESAGYRKIREELRTHRLAWYYSKLRWEWLRFRESNKPGFYIHGIGRGA